jgi:hypothetical protein
MLFKGTLEITAVTIEQGWKMSTLLFTKSVGPGNYSIMVESPADMATKVADKSEEEKDLVQRLNIVGHGNASGIQIGAHFVEKSNIKNYEADLRSLRKVMSRESLIHLQGCTVGQNKQLCVMLAQMAGVPVYAATQAENALLSFNFGGYIKAYPGGSVLENVSRP